MPSDGELRRAGRFLVSGLVFLAIAPGRTHPEEVRLKSAAIVLDVWQGKREGKRVIFNGHDAGELPNSRVKDNGLRSFWDLRHKIDLPEDAVRTIGANNQVRISGINRRDLFQVTNIFIEAETAGGRKLVSEIDERVYAFPGWKVQPFEGIVFAGGRTELPLAGPFTFPRKEGAQIPARNPTHGAHWGFEITKLKKLFLTTPLVRSGRAMGEIWAPENCRSAVEKIQEHLQKIAGVAFPARFIHLEERTWPRPDKMPAILIGFAGTNSAFLRLEAMGLIYPMDGTYPGPGGFALRTVHDPLGNGRNILVIGATDPAGAEAGADALVERLPQAPARNRELVVPRLMATRVTSPWAELKAREDRKVEKEEDRYERYRASRSSARWYQEILQRAASEPDGQPKKSLDARTYLQVMLRTRGAARHYLFAGDPEWLEAAKAGFLTLEKYARATRDAGRVLPDLLDEPGGNRGSLVAGWDAIEEEDCFTDEERLAITNLLAKLKLNIAWDQAEKRMYQPERRFQFYDVIPRHNHQTGPALDAFRVGDYFRRYYERPATRHQLAYGHWIIGRQGRTYRNSENAAGYSLWTIGHFYTYFLMQDRPEWFENGMNRKHVDWNLMLLDNLGFCAMYGSEVGGRARDALPHCRYITRSAYYYRDGSMLTLPDEVRRFYGRPARPAGLQARPRQGLLGVHALRFDKPHHEYLEHVGFNRVYRSEDANIPWERTFDKLTFRSSFGARDQYLVVDGDSRGYHSDLTGNAILHFSDNGRVFLTGRNLGYGRRGLKKFNTVAPLCRGKSELPPAASTLEHLASLENFGFSDTASLNYAGADWHRQILWSKEKYFLVLDSVQARERAPYSIRSWWHVLGEAQWNDRRLEIDQNGERFHLVNLDGARARTALVPTLQDWGGCPKVHFKGYAHARDILTQLTLESDVEMDVGRSYALANLIYTENDRQPARYEARLIRNSVALIEGPDGLAYAGTAGGAFAEGGLSLAAPLFIVSRRHVAFADGTHLAWRQSRLLAANAPVSLELDLETGEALMVSDSGSEISVMAKKSSTVRVDGSEPRTVRGDGLLRFPLPPGRHQVQLPPGPWRAFRKSLAKQLRKQWGKPVPFERFTAPLARVKVDDQLTLAWNYDGHGTARAIRTGDTNGNGRPEVLTGFESGRAALLDGQGHPFWQFDTGKPVNDVTLARLRPGNTRQAVLASDLLYAVGPAGKLLWKLNPNDSKYAAQDRPVAVYAADVEDDGRDELFVGSWRAAIFVIDGAGTVTYRNYGKYPDRGAVHGQRPCEFFVGDMNRDGVKEYVQPMSIFLRQTWRAGNHHCIGKDGRNGNYYYFWATPKEDLRDIEVTDLDGDGYYELAEAAGDCYVFWFPDRLGVERGLDMDFGETALCVSSGDVDGDGVGEFVCGTASGHVYAFKKEGRVLWFQFLGSPVRKIATGDFDGNGKADLACGLEDGRIAIVYDGGTRYSEWPTSGRIEDLAVEDLDRDGRPEILAASADGKVYALAHR